MLISALSLAMSATSGPVDVNALAVATSATRPHSHIHAPAEIDEDHGPLLLQLTYTGDVAGNVGGGLRRGARYLDNLDIVLEADLENLIDWKGAQVRLYGLYNNGASIGDLVGDAHAVNNIETGTRAVRLYEAWIDQKIGESLSLRAGLYDLNSEFDSLDAAGLFVGSAHGIGTEIAQTGENGPSIFPHTSLAARVALTPATGWVVRAAVLDGVPGNPARLKRTAVRLGNGDGALLIGEVEAPLGGGKLLVGHWRYSAEFEGHDGNAIANRNAGTYVRAEFPLAESGGRRIDGFARFGTANGQINMFDRFLSGGLKFSGWVPGREDDEFGLALATGFTSEAYRAATASGASEIALEATYRAPLRDWISVQPHVHYIVRPSADPATRNAVVLGLRTEISFSLLGG